MQVPKPGKSIYIRSKMSRYRFRRQLVRRVGWLKLLERE